MSRITVLGTGSWGTAIAISLANKGGHHVTLWSHRAEQAQALAEFRENRKFLPGYLLPESLHITGDDNVLKDAEILVSVIPSEFLRATIQRLRPHIHAGQVLISATKGIEDVSHLRMSQLIASELFPLTLPIGALSGPSFAQEVASGQPTAITLAVPQADIAQHIQQEFSSESLRLYTTTDIIGAELGGALKNVIAIAAGIVAGVGLGANSSAGLMTRGIAEITRLAVAAGGRRETLSGLSGIGDLILTCNGSLSRNRTVGVELGKGRRLDEILLSLGGKVAEGVRTTRAALGLARSLNVEMPITEQMELILDEGKPTRHAIRDLMLRPGKDE